MELEKAPSKSDFLDERFLLELVIRIVNAKSAEFPPSRHGFTFHACSNAFFAKVS